MPPEASIAAIMQQQMPQVGVLAALLTDASPEARRTILGETLFPLVEAIVHVDNAVNYNAAEVTGILLEMDHNELLHLLESPDALKSKASEAGDVLRRKQIPDLASFLKNASPETRRTVLGDPLVEESLYVDNAVEVTGKLPEMDHTEVLHLLKSPDALKSNVAEARDVLRRKQISDLAALLTDASPEARRTILGETLFPLVEAIVHVDNAVNYNAAEVTGMLLEMDHNELLHLLESPGALKSKAAEAGDVLRRKQIPDLASFLKNASPETRRTVLGDPLVEEILHVDNAVEVTGKLPEMDHTEVLHLLESPALKSNVAEARDVLRRKKLSDLAAAFTNASPKARRTVLGDPLV